MSTEIAKQLAEFTVKTTLADIPKEVVDFTKGLALKTVAGMLRGSSMPAGRRVVKMLRERPRQPELGVIGCGFKASCRDAVFANGYFAHASELEDDRFDEGTAFDITTFPITFPLAAKTRLSGKELLEASTLGLEVHTRTRLFPSQRFGLGGIPPTVGSAVAAARVLRLNIEQITSAMGLAMSGVATSYVNFGTDAHYFESALQCLQGLMAAELAEQGLTGNPDLVTFLNNFLGKDKVVAEKITEGLGKQWIFQEIWVKKYPCCFFTHRHIDTLLEIMEKNKLSYEQIETVEAHAGPTEEVVNRPEPKTLGDLQFSLQHVLGSAMLDKDVNYDHIAYEKISDPKSREARSKVKVIIHPDWPSEQMHDPARIVVKLKGGKQLSHERMYPIGSPKERLTMEQMKGLYRKFTRGVLPEEQIEWTLDAILNLEKLNDVEELMNVLTFRQKI